jgi:hypothetical protein
MKRIFIFVGVCLLVMSVLFAGNISVKKGKALEEVSNDFSIHSNKPIKLTSGVKKIVITIDGVKVMDDSVDLSGGSNVMLNIHLHGTIK